MERSLIDTNIVIDYLRGVPQARALVEQDPAPAISIITFMEVLVGAEPEQMATLRLFLAAFEQIVLDDAVAEEAITLRRTYRLKLPDAIIWASARISGRRLITRDVDLARLAPRQIEVPYQL